MARVKCPRCFTVNPDGQEKCVQCHTPLPRIRIEARPSPPPISPEIQLRPGQVISNRYSVLSLIGRGGMGCIYKVHDNTLNEEVALKTLLPQFLKDKLVVERFFNEARIARRMAHPNVVRVHDIGTSGNFVYISMEYLQGRSLRQMLEQLPPGQRLPLRQVLQIMDGLCSALEYAHQFTVHRDIKPENVMVLPEGTVKVMDFGISKLMGDVRMTGASVVMGTPFYMSPEQLRNSRDVDARADIYSVGVMLYEILTGNMPTGVPKPASQVSADVPPELDKIVQKCVESDPASRFQNAGELREALRPIQALVASGELRAGRARGRISARKVAGIAASLLIVAGMAGGVVWLESQDAGGAVRAAAPSAPSFMEQAESAIAQLREASEAEASGRPDLPSLVDDGEGRWNEALEQQRLGGGEAMLLKAREALQYYAAPLLRARAEGMVYIHPGWVQTEEGPVYVPAFFMDTTEVTYEQFAGFSAAVGGWRDSLALAPAGYGQLPVVYVTYYDAAAYAAHAGKRVPTAEQWSMAAVGSRSNPDKYPWGQEYQADGCNCESGRLAAVKSFPEDKTASGVFDMTGNASEWTRTVHRDGDPATAWPDFGDMMVIAGGNCSDPGDGLLLRTSMPYGGSHPQIGFRCVLEIPDTPEGVLGLLDQLRSGG